MTNPYARIGVPFSKKEFRELVRTAKREGRHPTDQARFLIVAALGDQPTNAAPAPPLSGTGEAATMKEVQP